MLVDGNVARYVFNYKLPAGYIDYEFAAPFPGIVATDTKLRPEDTYVLGPSKVELLNGEVHTSYHVERWDGLGIKNWSQYKFPCQAYIIPARDCIEFAAKEPGK